MCRSAEPGRRVRKRLADRKRKKRKRSSNATLACIRSRTQSGIRPLQEPLRTEPAVTASRSAKDDSPRAETVRMHKIWTRNFQFHMHLGLLAYSARAGQPRVGRSVSRTLPAGPVSSLPGLKTLLFVFCFFVKLFSVYGRHSTCFLVAIFDTAALGLRFYL